MREATRIEWLPIRTSIWSWSIRKIEMDARGRIYCTPKEFQNVLPGTSKSLGIPTPPIRGMLALAYQSWQRCYKKPRHKGRRNRLNSIPFPDPVIYLPVEGRIRVPGLGMVQYHKRDVPRGKNKNGRIVRRAFGWYRCMFIDAEQKAIPATGDGAIGSNPGFKHLITVCTGERVDHRKELQASLGRAQRGASLKERISNQRRQRHHHLNRRAVEENAVIVFSKDNLRGLSRADFGKSVAAAGGGQLRSIFDYKNRAGGRQYDDVSGKGSARTCSRCLAPTVPKERARLSVMQWPHNSNINAAVNSLVAGVATTRERSF